MKGLIIKDLMCLRKQLITFGFVVVGVLVISIMYVCSARFGNIATAGQEMLATNDMTSTDAKNLATMALILFMLLPIATVGDMACIFEEDGRAGFIRMASAMPISIKKRVGAKFITIFAMFGIGALVDIVIAFVLSMITDIIVFKDFLGIIVSASSVMCIYSALIIVLCLIMGAGKENYARLISPILIVVIASAVNYSRIKDALINKNTNGIDDFMIFIKQKFYILLIAAITVIALSFLVSVYAAERKRGVV